MIRKDVPQIDPYWLQSALFEEFPNVLADQCWSAWYASDILFDARGHAGPPPKLGGVEGKGDL